MEKIKYIQNIDFIKKLLKDFFEGIKNEKIYIENDKINENIIIKLETGMIKFINDNIEYANRKMDLFDKNLINENEKIKIWKISIYKNMFFNLPFTLEDVIFLPYNYIEKCMNDKNNINSFRKTLIHEKIHIIQKKNQKVWNDYIIKNTKWSKIKNENMKLFFQSCYTRNNNKIYNPDTKYINDSLFFYNFNDKTYYGEMFEKNKKINILWYEVYNKDEKYFLYPTNEKINIYEHPYEELAYIMSENLVNNEY